MVGGNDFNEAALQHRHQRPPPAGVGLQAVHLGDRSRARASRPAPATPRTRRSSRFPTRRTSTSTSTTTTTSTTAAPASRRRPSTRTTPCTRSSPSATPCDARRAVAGVPPSGAGPSGSPTPRTRWASTRSSRRIPSMVLGAIDPGVSPLEMAHAFETISHRRRACGRQPGFEPRPQRQARAARPRRDRQGQLARMATRSPRTRPGRSASSPRASPRPMKNILRENVLAGTGVLAQSAGSKPGARRGRPRTTATPGSAAAPITSPPVSGWATQTAPSRCPPTTTAARSTAAPTLR